MNAQTVHPRLFREQDGDIRVLDGSTIAILGYGRLGEPLALNLRESFAAAELSARVIVGSEDEASSAAAQAAGFKTVSLTEAAAEADMALMLLPDEVQQDRCDGIFAGLKSGASIVFASGYAIAYDHVVTPADSDVLLFAPRMGGEAIRQRYLDRQGYMSYLGVEHDASGQGLNRVLALAAAAGSLSLGALEMTAQQEVALDLFVEQAFGPWLGAALLSRPDEMTMRCFAGVLDGPRVSTARRALGLIETRSTVGLVRAVDQMLKAADVEYEGSYKVGYFLTASAIRGDVGAVRVAVEAGAQEAEKHGELVSTHVIPQLYGDVEQRLLHR